MLYKKKVPKTSIENYVSSYEALNVPDENELPADCHPNNYWMSKVADEEVKLFNSKTSLFGIGGIEERDTYFGKIWIANHVRAIADLVLHLE